jgi:predicted nucleic acid-binding protein
MKFWDSSAILPLIVKESTTPFLLELKKSDDEMVVWWGTETECLSALARREREGGLDRAAVSLAEGNLAKILSRSYEVQPTTEVRRMARRLLMTHPLRAADALQLASALFFSGIQVPELPFVTLDKNLASSAGKEGFSLISIESTH